MKHREFKEKEIVQSKGKSRKEEIKKKISRELQRVKLREKK